MEDDIGPDEIVEDLLAAKDLFEPGESDDYGGDDTGVVPTSTPARDRGLFHETTRAG